jgi:hypothetical protein
MPAREATEAQCLAIQPIQIPTALQMTASINTAITLRETPSSARIFSCFMALPTTRGGPALMMLAQKAPGAGYALLLDLLIGAR